MEARHSTVGQYLRAGHGGNAYHDGGYACGIIEYGVFSVGKLFHGGGQKRACSFRLMLMLGVAQGVQLLCNCSGRAIYPAFVYQNLI